MEQQHEMVLENIHSSGAEEWYCPICGRRMTITWDPWKKIVLEPGDEYAAHRASKGGLELKSQITEANSDISSADDPLAQDPYLAPWQRWLDSVDSDDLWNGKVQ